MNWYAFAYPHLIAYAVHFRADDSKSAERWFKEVLMIG